MIFEFKASKIYIPLLGTARSIRLYLKRRKEEEDVVVAWSRDRCYLEKFSCL